MLWMLPLAGAAAGALINKKKPLKGALIGAGLGAGGGMLAPALLGGAGAAGAAAGGGSSAAGLLGAAAPAAAAPAPAGASGMLGGLAAYAKPLSSGLTMANQAQGLMQQEPGQPAQPAQLNTQSPDFGGLLAAQNQIDSQRMQEDLQRRLAQQQAIQGLLGGGYGRSY